MRIQLSSFHVINSLSPTGFIGFVAFDVEAMTALSAAKRQWGTESQYRELTAFETVEYTKRGIAVFGASCN